MSLRRLRPLVLLAAVAGALLAAPAAHAQVALRGVQLHSLWFSSPIENIDRELELAARAHSNTVRVDVAWSSLETDGAGVYTQDYVRRLDRFFDGALARGMRVVATIHGTPCWASSAPETAKLGCTGAWWDRGVTAYPPRNPYDYARAVRWLTTRYGDGLAALEVWNEPNLWFLNAPDQAAAYVQLLRAAYPLAKQGDPDVPVIAGSIAMSDAPFLQRLYAQGLKGLHDGLAIHPYNEWRAPDDPHTEEWRTHAMLPGLRWMRDIMVANGEGDKKIWATELGWTNCTVGAHRWCVTAEKQATYTEQAISLLNLEPYVHAALIYNLRDKGRDRNYTEDNFGLVDRDFRPKPAYHAMQRAFAKFATGIDQIGLDSGAFSAAGGAKRKLAQADFDAERKAASGSAGKGLTMRVVRKRGEIWIAGRGRPRTAGTVRVGARRLRVRTNAKGQFSRKLGRPPAGRRIVLVLGGASRHALIPR
jgi:polysaccharide biosynthesis protein PslG